MPTSPRGNSTMAFKLNLKDFDYKQFVLQRGEWIGLGVVLLIVIPILISGVAKVITAGSPASKAHEFQDLAANLEKKIQESRLRADADKRPKQCSKAVSFAAV